VSPSPALRAQQSTLQPLAECAEIERSLVVGEARRLKGDERLQRQEPVEPEDPVLNRVQDALERRMDSASAKRVVITARGHHDHRPPAPLT